MEIQAAPVKPMGGDFPFRGQRPGSSVDQRAVLAFAVPKRGHAEGHRPVCRLLENGGVAVVPHLVAVVLEGLAEGAQFGPRFMAGRTGHAVLPSESRQRGSGTTIREKKESKERTKKQSGCQPWHSSLHAVRTTQGHTPSSA